MKLAEVTEGLRRKDQERRREEVPFKQEHHDDPALPFIIAAPSMASPTIPSPRSSLQSGLSKLTAVSRKMDCTVSDKMDKMKHMQITSLNKKRFGNLLQSIFNVRLARWEVSALMDYFDDDGSGCLDFVEFKQLLFKLVDRGRAEQLLS
mmetsp:Transcript_20818/g.38914  ORF Transcript_20818/g.38914 Transcript_20818/m.38914 type:complete len:149 (+) Transcript_20818:209-655(+)